MDKPVSVSTSVVPKSQCRSALGIVFLPALVWTVGGLIALMRTSDPTLVRQVLYPLVGTELVVAGTLLLVVHAWVFGTQPNPGPAAGLVVVAVVCAGLAVEHLTAAADLFAVSLAALTVGLLIRRPRAFASAGMILGNGPLAAAVRGGRRCAECRTPDGCPQSSPSADRPVWNRRNVGPGAGRLGRLAGWLAVVDCGSRS